MLTKIATSDLHTNADDSFFENNHFSTRTIQTIERLVSVSEQRSSFIVAFIPTLLSTLQSTQYFELFPGPGKPNIADGK